MIKLNLKEPEFGKLDCTQDWVNKIVIEIDSTDVIKPINSDGKINVYTKPTLDYFIDENYKKKYKKNKYFTDILKTVSNDNSSQIYEEMNVQIDEEDEYELETLEEMLMSKMLLSQSMYTNTMDEIEVMIIFRAKFEFICS